MQLQSERDSTQVWIYQNCAVSIVPGKAQQAGLSRAIIFQSVYQRRNIRAGTSSDRVENIADRRKTGFNSRAVRMNASLHNSANARYKFHRACNSNNARGSTDDIDHVVGAAAGANRIPVCIERANGNWNP